MAITDRHAHWENVYTTKAEAEVSWFQESPAVSLALIQATGVPGDAAIVDIGGGASRLVDALLHDGYSAVTVLDLSDHALAAARPNSAAARHRCSGLPPMSPRGSPPRLSMSGMTGPPSIS